MAIPSTGNISIKEAAGSTRSIDTAVTATSSGSLVTLGQNSINYTGGRSSITNDTDASPYSMLEYAGYAHTWSTTGTATEVTIGKTTRWDLNLADSTPDNVGGTLNDVLSYPGGTGLRLLWASLNTDWASLRIGPTSSSYTTIARGVFSVDGNTHYLQNGVTYITNTEGASMYFELLT